MAVLLAPASPASAETLSAAERERLAAGAVVVRTRAVPGFPWPEVTAWRHVRATPADVTAVYLDFDAQPQWVPDLVATRVVEREAPGVARVSYEYEVTGPNERYTVTVAVRPAAAGFVVAWRLREARYARRLTGELHAHPTPDGSLVAYTTRIDPGALGVRFGTPDSVARRLEATADALAARVERLAATEPRRLAALVETLHAMVPTR